jgi:molybdopterin-guanine dinucleotide biosynthesis protein A
LGICPGEPGLKMKDAMEEEKSCPIKPLSGLIMAGGASRRMGRDKALLNYHGQAQYLHLAALLQAVGVPPFLSCQASQQQAWQPPIECILDTEAGQGPLAGLKAAFRHNPQTAWLVVACDLVDLNQASLNQLLHSRRPEVDVTAFRSPFDQGAEPLLAIWEPSVAEPLARAFARGERSPRRFLQQQRLHLIEPEQPDALKNVNHPR